MRIIVLRLGGSDLLIGLSSIIKFYKQYVRTMKRYRLNTYHVYPIIWRIQNRQKSQNY